MYIFDAKQSTFYKNLEIFIFVCLRVILTFLDSAAAWLAGPSVPQLQVWKNMATRLFHMVAGVSARPKIASCFDADVMVGSVFYDHVRWSCNK